MSAPISWIDVQAKQIPVLKEQIGQNPRHHLDNLIQEVAQPQFAATICKANIEKLTGAIKNINLESPLVRRLYYTLRVNKKLFPNQEKKHVAEQLQTTVSIDHLLTNMNGRSEDLLFLLKQGERLPGNSPNGAALFRFLCKRGSDRTLYPILTSLICQHLEFFYQETGAADVDISHQDESERNGFDDFLDAGGNIALLLSGIKLEDRQDMAFNYLECSESVIRRMSPVDVIIILSEPTTRFCWLNNMESLDFLEGSKLKAFAQFVDFEVPKGVANGVDYLKSYLPAIQKLSFLQQTIFLESLSSQVRRSISNAYAATKNGFAQDKFQLSAAIHAILPYVKDKISSAEQLSALDELKAFKGEPGKINENEVLGKIHAMMGKLQILNLWCPSPCYEKILAAIKALVPILNKGNPEVKSVYKAVAEGALESLKYETLKEALSPIAKNDHINLDEEIDWDDYVKAFYSQTDLQTLPKEPDKTSATHKTWQAETKGHLQLFLSSHFPSTTTWNDVKLKYQQLTQLDEPSKKRLKMVIKK